MISAPLIRFVLTAAFRDKLMMTLVLMILMSAGVSVFLGGSGLTEQESFALVFGAGGLRFLCVIGLVLFCCFYMRRCFETKEVEFLLSRPISRVTFLLSHAFAFIVLAVLVALVVAGAVFFLGRPDTGGWLLWSASVAIECVLMTMIALFFSMVLSSASGSALAALGFYALCRLVGMLIGIAAQPSESPVFAVLNNLMNVISIILPRLDLMGQTSWLVYGLDGSAETLSLMHNATGYAVNMLEMLGVGGFIAVQGLVFTLLLLVAAAFDFIRREF